MSICVRCVTENVVVHRVKTDGPYSGQSYKLIVVNFRVVLCENGLIIMSSWSARCSACNSEQSSVVSSYYSTGSPQLQPVAVLCLDRREGAEAPSFAPDPSTFVATCDLFSPKSKKAIK